MSETEKSERAQKKKLVQRSESRVQEDHLAGQEDTCKTDGGSSYLYP